MILLTGRLICTDEQEAQIVRRHLSDHIRLTRAEPGCLSFEVKPTADPLIWQVDESFADQTGFDAHQTRTKVSPWFAATAQIRRDFTVTEAPDPGQKTNAPRPPPRPE